MTLSNWNADASFYYREDATADIASIDSSAVCGNLADAMKNAIVLYQNISIAEAVIPAPYTVESETHFSEETPLI